MEQRQDYVELQIDMLSKVLRKLLEKLLKLKSDDEAEQNEVWDYQIAVAQKELKLKDLKNISNEDLIGTLLKDYHYDHENIKLLADVLYTMSKKSSSDFNAGAKALILYHHYIANAKNNIDFLAYSRREELSKL
jgi:hypothetical protein